MTVPLCTACHHDTADTADFCTHCGKEFGLADWLRGLFSYSRREGTVGPRRLASLVLLAVGVFALLALLKEGADRLLDESPGQLHPGALGPPIRSSTQPTAAKSYSNQGGQWLFEVQGRMASLAAESGSNTSFHVWCKGDHIEMALSVESPPGLAPTSDGPIGTESVVVSFGTDRGTILGAPALMQWHPRSSTTSLVLFLTQSQEFLTDELIRHKSIYFTLSDGRTKDFLLPANTVTVLRRLYNVCDVPWPG